MQWNYKIHGMHCEACVKKIQKALASAPFNVKHVGFSPPRLQIVATEASSLSTINQYLAHAGNYRVEQERDGSLYAYSRSFTLLYEYRKRRDSALLSYFPHYGLYRWSGFLK